MDKKISVHISIGDDQFSCSVDELVDMFFDRFIDKLVESPKKSKHLEAVLKPQLEKNDLDATYTYKLVLSSKGMDEPMLKDVIVSTYHKLVKEGFIDGKRKDYQTIFLDAEPLRREVKWLGTRKELKYLVCILSGKDFTELTPDSKDKYVCTLKGKGKEHSVFYSNSYILQKAANSFVDADKKTFPPKGIETNNEVTPIKPARKHFLNEVVTLFNTK